MAQSSEPTAVAAADAGGLEAAGEEGPGPKPPQPCDVCNSAVSKYCCPRCSKRTCGLACVQAHKEQDGCSGKRDRTGFVGRGQLNERSLLSDYRFLEEVQLADDVAKRRRPPAPKPELPQFLQSLVYQARRRGVQLHILSPGMARRVSNTTRYDGRARTLHWRVEWRFPAAGDATASDVRADERAPLGALLATHLALKPGAAARHHQLREFVEAGAEALTVLLRKERTPANAVAYHRLDPRRPLGAALEGKVIVEFPSLLVLLPREVGEYTVLEEEEGAAPAAAARGPPAEPAAGVPPPDGAPAAVPDTPGDGEPASA